MSDACGFCGHADAPEKVYAPLRSCIEELICRQGVREFYVGSEGAFDRMALRALREMKKGMDDGVWELDADVTHDAEHSSEASD